MAPVFSVRVRILTLGLLRAMWNRQWAFLDSGYDGRLKDGDGRRDYEESMSSSEANMSSVTLESGERPDKRP